jgi:glycosyltransferase involved in cell wall biosynthesis
MKKIKIAFIKFGGLAAGGTEKYLQTLACNLPPEQFEVDYYYTDAAPLIGNNWKHPDTDPERQKYMENHNINLIKVSCKARDDRRGPPYEWVETDFWSLFDENKYDIVQTGRSGYREFPFDRMSSSRFVDSIHAEGAQGIEKRDNILKTVLLSKAHVHRWLANGGDPDKVEIISPLVEMPFPKCESTLRDDYNIPSNSFIFGMHQGNRDDIYSGLPLEAYSLIENDNTMFVLLGGSARYRTQAANLRIKNIKFIDFTGNADKIHNFVAALDVFAHGRLDGEVCSAAIIEALYHGKPIITHSALNMGHAEQIEGCGFMATTTPEYANYMRYLLKTPLVYDKLSMAAWEKYTKLYSLESCLNRYISLYEEAVTNAHKV